MEIYDALAKARGRGERAVLVTVLEVAGDAPSHPGAKLVVTDQGPVAGTLGCSEFDHAGRRLAGEALAGGEPLRRRLDFDEHGHERALELFAEVHEPEPAVLILGTTPVGREVAALARRLERRVTLVGPGGDATVPAGVEVRADDPERYLLNAPPGSSDAVLVTDHDAPWVEEVLRVALASEAYFVGMLGSRRHAPDAVRTLRAQGVPEAHIAKLRAPVGLDIGSRTPAEIALSIIAEIVAAERGADGGRLGLDWSAQPT
ncbi:XdhC family protein [Egibacter rhizosphaerae]|uniref:XdhC family protein n=1 Tax=Egibacter rhizosphaerae TaxID=1670831 RepID=A0A411YAR3_9ACTN|nr:XdhC family protein [Egibacter rhizosphaerae]QBI18286.1 XdhC family protein [Egibacter rhizosphaerae]